MSECGENCTCEQAHARRKLKVKDEAKRSSMTKAQKRETRLQRLRDKRRQ